MGQKQTGRSSGCVLGTIGLILGFLVGFAFDALLEAATGIVVRRGFATDMRAALIKAFIGGIAGLIAGQLLGEYLSKPRDNENQHEGPPGDADNRLSPQTRQDMTGSQQNENSPWNGVSPMDDKSSLGLVRSRWFPAPSLPGPLSNVASG